MQQKQLNNISAKILEINPKHKLLRHISENMAATSPENVNNARDIVHLLYDQACIMENEPVKNVADFAKRMNNLLSLV